MLAALEPTCDRARERVAREDLDQWTFGTIHPSPDSWAAGDRQGICEVSRRDGSLVQESLLEPVDAPG